ncbi:MAG: sensor histidine kinase, partial [Bacteroidota bacterium]
VHLDKSTDQIESFLLSIDGEWEYYPERFLVHEDFYDEIPESGIVVEVPSYWTDYQLDGKAPKAKSFATYRKKIYLPDKHPDVLGLRIPVFDDSYRLYIDNRLLSESGQLAVNESESSPGYKPVTAIFEIKADSFDIIIHVSNFHHRRGGFWQSMVLGTKDKILKQRELHTLISYTSLGVLLAFSFFFLFFYLFYKHNKLALFFSIFLVGILLRLLSTDTYPILLFNPGWQNIIRLEYLGSFMALTGGLWYFYCLFPSQLVKKITWVLTVVNFLIFPLIIFTRVEIFAYTMFILQPVSIIAILYYFPLSLRDVIRGDKEKLLFLIAILVFAIALINDVLIANSKIALTRNYVIHFAVQFFVFIQALIIIRQWIFAFKEKERLHNEIKYMNRNLEQMVRERTNELNFKNEKVNKQNKQIEEKNMKLESTMGFNQKLFSIIAHDLKSPVSSLLQVSDYLYKTRKDPELRSIYQSIFALSNSAYTLIDNLLYWGRSQGSGIRLNKAPLQVEPFLKELLDFFKETLQQKSIEMELIIKEKVTCMLDKQILLIIFRNLISNAIKFTPRGGRVVLMAKTRREENQVIIEIHDSGKGMPKSVIENMKKGIFPDSTYGTSNEKGSGLGLPLCFELTGLHGGSIEIESKEGAGTLVKLYFQCQNPSKN